MFNYLKILLSRNQHDMQGRKVKPKRMNLEYWQGAVNLGDTLAPVVYRWMLDRKNYDKDIRMPQTRHFLGIGSVLGISYHDAVVWGSGILNLNRMRALHKRSWFIKYDIRAVRGPLTQKLMSACGYNCPEVFGDPAVLMPLIYRPDSIEKDGTVAVVVNYTQESPALPAGCKAIDINTDDFKKFIDEIVSSKMVISSSLHGIILAESYGIPAILIKTGMENFLFKFYDWYYSTGRYTVRIADSIEEALTMEPMPLPDITVLQNNLLDSFPYDLWGG